VEDRPPGVDPAWLAPTPADTWMSTTSCGQIACWKSSFMVAKPALMLRYAGTVQMPRRTKLDMPPVIVCGWAGSVPSRARSLVGDIRRTSVDGGRTGRSATKPSRCAYVRACRASRERSSSSPAVSRPSAYCCMSTWTTRSRSSWPTRMMPASVTCPWYEKRLARWRSQDPGGRASEWTGRERRAYPRRVRSALLLLRCRDEA
jgi:hypothetical protein